MTPEKLLKQVQEKVLQAIVDQALWQAGDLVVIAVSGGPDSLCLLHVLHQHRLEHGARLHVAHLDHRLRGDVSAEEAVQVVEWARAWGLPVTAAERDVPALLRERPASLEEAARRARYRFLCALAAAQGASAIALGHTADDQVETILMHLIRGAGLGGLRGMLPLAPVAPWMTEGLKRKRPLHLVRPLLGISRQETVAYCNAAALSPLQDAWNQDPRFLRVRLRQEVLPLLKTINPRLPQALLRLGQLAGWLEQDLEKSLDEQWPALVEPTAQGLRLKLSTWTALSLSLRLVALRRAVEQVRGHKRDLGWEAVVAAGRLEQMPVGSEVSLVDGLVARLEYDALFVGQGPPAVGPWPDLGPESRPLQIPGCNPLPGGATLEAREYRREEVGGDPWRQASPLEVWLDADRCGPQLWLRHWQPGDLLQPLGMAGRKKLQDLFVDEKVPRAERSRVPLLVSPQGIVWVVGYRLDERFRVRPETAKLLWLCWS
ncbi:MAG: tRNA lysidine(34) synthetase TilS [Chloroflexia bacterium]|nr:tRNA lysidine(34) synthetase TilS [Chloroflexia bacterium]